MNILVETKRTVIPFFHENRDLPEEEQMVATYRIPDLTLKRRLKPPPKLDFDYDENGKVTGGHTQVSTDPAAVVAGMLINITHLSYENDKGVHQVTNAKELLAGPPDFEPLIDELYKEFSKELDRVVDEKN